ncbi:hypothetical protein BDV95DRAFT_563427 [Massariosphaeria phaeospora]|uniref:Inosine/uridine-preferring nucleoside hydrolase domain-containing protein n=1 Tax=Massariosphaeria phaeospora TaxID=100035 RepID=A0A7C8MD28_9PLEO|nr:hypothetical protein BDV95DRAFT_563427 [Massariosphaeria phaeospora]
MVRISQSTFLQGLTCLAACASLVIAAPLPKHVSRDESVPEESLAPNSPEEESLAQSGPPGPPPKRPKLMIIDTDMLNFVDDPLAIGLANILQTRGEVEILGVISSVFSRYVPPAIDAINTYYKHPYIPTAIQKPVNNDLRDPMYPQVNEYLTGLVNNFPQDVKDGSLTDQPVTLYRQLLAKAPPNSVTIANIGYSDNLYKLLMSKPDSISPLTGHELVKQKVAELVVQANPEGQSFNFVAHDPKFAIYVMTHWPTLATYVPEAIGSEVLLGARLSKLDLKKNPVAYAFTTIEGVGANTPAWDSTAVYFAVRGLDDVYTYERNRGEITFTPDGTASWNYNSPSKLQRSVGLKIQAGTFAKRIEDLLLLKP